MVSVENISKTYDKGKIIALDQINLEIKEGEIFGLIGPDGAGKTTLFRLLSTLLLPDKGTAQVAGFDIKTQYAAIRNIVGYMPGKFSLYQDLSILENIQFFATVFNTTLAQNYHLIEDIYVQIEPFKHRPAGKLSGGMKQKLALCCALIHEPKILFLDEPTTGVDPVSRKEFWDMLLRLKARGITIVVSTPYMDEAERCDRIALIQKGKIMEVNSLANILSKHNHSLFAVSASNRHSLLQDVRAYPATSSFFAFGESNHLTFKAGQEDTEALKTFLISKGHQNLKIEKISPDIEDTFIKLMLENA